MKNYVVYSNKISQQPDSAHEIHDVMCANAVANLGYRTILVYPDNNYHSPDPFSLINPFNPRKPDNQFTEFYNVQDKLKVAPLRIPSWMNKLGKLGNNSTIICKYYLPFYIRSSTNLLHTRDWNFAQAAIKNKIPTVYERHYFAKSSFEPEIVNNPYLKLVISQSEPIQQSLIQAGMPPERTIWLHNGCSPLFAVRQPQEAAIWREELLQNGQKYLVVYSGALYKFKGIDLLIDVAKQLPYIQFAITGGTEEQVNAYQQLAREKQVKNIIFLGWINPRARLISLLQSADILAHPHLAGQAADFTNPVKFFQYMASGTPIASTEILPLMEFKSSLKIAGWCPPDNPISFAKTIESVLQKYPRKLEGYSENIELASQFSWEKRAARIISYVDNLRSLQELSMGEIKTVSHQERIKIF